ncbi:MAG: rhomboid family intramembrane serine protease [Nanoarchaeota archaeon]
MKIKPIFFISIAIAFASLVIFFIPYSLKMFAFSGTKFFSGEFWRLITFSFAHVNASHLFENVVVIVLVSILGYEFGLSGKLFLLFFLGVSFLVAILDAIIFPLLVIAGASLGIYGVAGALSIKGSNFIPKRYLIPLLGVTVFFTYFFGSFTCAECSRDFVQALFHFSGFLTGIILVYIPRKFKNKKYVLRHV